MLFTDTVPGGPGGNGGPVGPKLTPGDFTQPAATEPIGVGPLIVTVGGEGGSPTGIDFPNPGPTHCPSFPHLQQTAPITFVVPQGSTALTAVLPAPTGHHHHHPDGPGGQALAAAAGGGAGPGAGADAAQKGPSISKPPSSRGAGAAAGAGGGPAGGAGAGPGRAAAPGRGPF